MPACHKSGFTLIELLVVVLIIGILSAVALPQYEKAVIKSRASTMLASLRGLATAQEAYRLANGDYATQYDQLDLSFDTLPDKNPTDGRGYLAETSSDAVRANKHFKMVINGNASFLHSTAIFINGTYEGAGLLIPHYVNNLGGVEKDALYCFEYSRVKGKFCKPFYDAVLVGNANSIDYYKMP